MCVCVWRGWLYVHVSVYSCVCVSVCRLYVFLCMCAGVRMYYSCVCLCAAYTAPTSPPASIVVRNSPADDAVIYSGPPCIAAVRCLFRPAVYRDIALQDRLFCSFFRVRRISTIRQTLPTSFQRTATFCVGPVLHHFGVHCRRTFSSES